MPRRYVVTNDNTYIRLSSGARLTWRDPSALDASSIAQKNFTSVSTGDSHQLTDIISFSDRIFISGEVGYLLRYHLGNGSTRLDPFGINDVRGLAVGSANRLIALAADGIHYSDDYGDNWTQSSTDTTMSDISSNSSGNIVAVSTASANGLVSNDNGVSFSSSSQNDLAAGVRPQVTRYYPSVGLFVNLCTGGIINTSTNGTTWTQRNYNPTVGSPVWTSQAIFNNLLYIGDNSGIIYEVSADFSTITQLSDNFYEDTDFDVGGLFVANDKLYAGHMLRAIQFKDSGGVFLPSTLGFLFASDTMIRNFTIFDGDIWGICGNDIVKSMSQ